MLNAQEPVCAPVLPLKTPEDPSIERIYKGHKDVINSVSFRPNSQQLATASNDHSVMLWNFKPSIRAFRYIGHKAPVTCVDFSPSGNLLASASVDKTIRLWTPTVNGDVTVFHAHTSAVRAVQFSTDSLMLLSCSDDKSVKIWSTHKTKFQGTLSGHLNWVRTAKFSPDSRLVISGSDDKTMKLWDLRTKDCVRTYTDHSGQVTSVQFHPSASIIASASTDKTIKLYDIRTHALIQHYENAHVNERGNASGGVNSIAFGGRAGEWLISSGVDGLVKIWDIKEGHLFFNVHGHKNGPTTAATFSPDGKFFATTGTDNALMLWRSNLDKSMAQPLPKTEPKHVFDDVPSKELDENQQELERNPVQVIPTAQVLDHPEPVTKQDAPQTNPESSGESIKKEMKDLIESGFQKMSGEYATAMQTIVTQLDVLTQTMGILESRITHNEDKVENLTQKMGLLINRLARIDMEQEKKEQVNE